MDKLTRVFTSKSNDQINQTAYFTWEDGSSYDGEIFDGKPDGQGTYIWPDGDKFIGTWKKGKRNGLGCHSRKNGFIFIGEFKNNLPHGNGFYVGPDGTSYSGTWVAGKQQGKGFLRDSKDGIIFYGKWKAGFPKLTKTNNL